MHLIIEKQESLGQDKISKNGLTKEVFFVAKNIPFNILVSSPHINLTSSPLTAKLYYDFNSISELREVETLKSHPIEYVSHVNDLGDRATVEIRASVLSSQHEGALFRIKLSAADSKTRKGVEVFSYPIKVISKRNQAKRMIAKNELAATDPIPPPKRATSDQITEALSRLEQQQKEQNELIRLLISKEQNNNNNNIQTSPSSSSSITTTNTSLPSFSTSIPIPDPNDMDFETAFKKLLDAYRRIPEDDRPNKIRKTFANTCSNDSEVMKDFINQVNIETDSSNTPPMDSNYFNMFNGISDCSPVTSSPDSGFSTNNEVM